MRTKDNQHLPPYYTNIKVKEYIDRRKQRIAEGINPIINAIDYKGQNPELEKEREQLREEIKNKDPEYYLQVYPIYTE